MTAGYSAVDIQPTDAGFQIRFTLTNRGKQPWSPAEVQLGYQIFDPRTEQLVTDGARAALPAAVPAGGSAEMAMAVELPAGGQPWRVILSPLIEDQAWFYERHSPFLLVDTTNGPRARVATQGSLRWPRLARTVARAAVYPFRTIGLHSSLIRSMVRRDILGRYRGSFGGLFWTVLNPLLLMATYAFVFGVVLQQRFGTDGRPSNFVVYFLAGMLPWLAFSEAVGRAPTTVIEHQNFVKKLVFPIEILPINLVFAGLFSELWGVIIFAVGMIAFGYPLPLTALWLPVLLVPQIMLTLGLCWGLAALGVFIRDLGQIIGFALTIWFFLTPICYPEAGIPERFAWLYGWNPMFVLVRAYRDIFLEAAVPDLAALGALSVFAFAVLVGGFAAYWRLRRSFADLL